MTTVELFNAEGARAVVERDSETHKEYIERGYTVEKPAPKAEKTADPGEGDSRSGLDRNVADILPEVEASEDAEQLQAWLDEENAKDKPRKGLVAEIEKRLKALGGQ